MNSRWAPRPPSLAWGAWHRVGRVAGTLGLVAGLVAAGFAPAAWAQPAVLTISTNNAPLDRKVLEGVSQEALRRIGVEFKLVGLPSERSLVAANQGEVDGEGLRVANLGDQYPNLLRVPERYVGIAFVAFARDASISLDQGWDALKPYRVAFINGWKMFEANAGHARVVHKVERPEQLFEMLEHGHIDLALYTRADGLALVRRLGYSSIAPLAPSLKDVDLFLYLHKRHAAQVPRLAAAIRSMKADGSYNRLLSAAAAE